ncbi:MAG: phosphate ABC transporter ATP-binding protein [Synechococcaceae cyanobacterium SM2_3_2]|nr:phosphate ABC transporter ATP-binding protein [Synechococcaceae cyanobacterium SM2_3_2]
MDPITQGSRTKASRKSRPEFESSEPKEKLRSIVDIKNVSVYYGSSLAISDITLKIARNNITAFIGPSGCGKSTLLRSINRMNDLIPSARVEGNIVLGTQNVYDPEVDPTDIRRRIGLVFQKPNPFPKSIYDNVAFGPRINGYTGDMNELVERVLRQAALWDEVKDKLNENGMALSGGQQQRLCIARALSIQPEIVLMDEPCSALDPISTLRVEQLIKELKRKYTIIIVTHNMQQAARVSDFTAFINTEVDDNDKRFGRLVEYNKTEKIFNEPANAKTEEYVSGRFG